MRSFWIAGAAAVALAISAGAGAEEAATMEDAAKAVATQVATDAAKSAATDAAAKVEADTADNVVQVTPTGDQLVKVNSGNETVDAAANYAVKCGEKFAAMKACESMGAFKAIACKKAAEFRYRGVECPLQQQ